MIKRIIFDFDNTLVRWKDEYDDAIKETVKHFDLAVDYKELSREVDKYEYIAKRYDKQDLINYLNEKFKLNLGMEFLDYWLPRLGKMSYASDKLIDTLDYLSKKYELVVLTNWFRECQIDRMKHANIYKYFKEVYGGEVTKKPHKEAFIRALGDKNIDECIMIGDNANMDIKPAISLGIKVIMLASKKFDNIDTINSILELKEML